MKLFFTLILMLGLYTHASCQEVLTHQMRQVADFEFSNELSENQHVWRFSTALVSDNTFVTTIYNNTDSVYVTETVTYGPYGHESVTSVEYQLCGNPLTTNYTEGDISYNLQNVYGFANNSRSRSLLELNGVTHSIIANSYDDLGRVTAVRKGNDNHEGRFTYNLHGNLTSICWSDSKINFTQNLYYASGPGTPLYNGSISAMTWKIGKGENRLRGYRYTYNELGWLTEAAYGENTNLQSNTHRYTERVLEYNANGAMKRFQRHGLKDDGIYGKIDNLHISLDGNRIISVKDDAAPVTRYANADFNESDLPGRHFTYDSEGALTSDLDRGVSAIRYDDLGNPVTIEFLDGAETTYVYTPAGEKIRTVHHTPFDVSAGSGSQQLPSTLFVNDTTDYIGPVIYRNGVASSIRYEGGYADFESGTLAPQFYHYITDYLGNNRGVLRSSDGNLVQITHYYPFGAVYADMGMGGEAQPFKFGDKELDMMHGLYHYDYLARSYDPILCVFTRNDNCATDYPHISPHAFCGNNPVMYIDPDGNKTYRISYDGQVCTPIDDDNDYDTVIFYKPESNGEEISCSVKLDKGSVLSVNHYNAWNGRKYFVMKIRGDENGTKVFEAVADFNENKVGTTKETEYEKLEYSYIKTGIEGRKGLNFFSTSGDNLKEKSLDKLLKGQLEHDYTVREYIHNHAFGNPPSGFDPLNGYGKGDYLLAKYFEKNLPGCKLRTYSKGKYTDYSSKSNYIDFFK